MTDNLKQLALAAAAFKPTARELDNPDYIKRAMAAHRAFADAAPPDAMQDVASITALSHVQSKGSCSMKCCDIKNNRRRRRQKT